MEDTAIVIEAGDRRLPASAREAREVLQTIRIKRGFLGDEHEEKLSQIDVGLRQAIQNLQKELRRKTAKYTNSIAGELYSSKTRFFYELLQNADDSDFPHDRGEPRVTISLYPDRVVIDTNETGFTIANIKAICDTGESSKKSSAEDKSIGEKGYGFKSVFAVAHRARIQSGCWSFYFEHREGDDGLGMITPIDIDPVDLPAAVNTRIELSLNDVSDALFQRLAQALTELHETTIFFLQKVETLAVRIHPYEKAETGWEIQKKIVRDQRIVLDSVVSLTRRETIEGSSERADTKLYHVVEQDVEDMPADRHRIGRSQSQLKLAFPFDALTQLPLIGADGQQIFAYLPLYQKPNLPFLIQGDFITSTSRESILDCDWNVHLRANIATTFCKAVQLFYYDEKLRYHWPKYLPVLVAGGFEARLFSLIKEKIAELRVFETWQSRNRAFLSQVRILPTCFTHNAAPLFEDLQEEAYLAPEYAWIDESFSSQIGIKHLTQLELLARLTNDLSRPTSRLRNTAASDPWHETSSAALLGMLSAPASGMVSQIIRGQKLIPLRQPGGECPEPIEVADWTSAPGTASIPVYFPETLIDNARNRQATRSSLKIPRGLELRVLHQQSSVGIQRRALFAKLGVNVCPPILVTNAIFELHRMNKFPRGQTVLTYVAQLQYLFWFHDVIGPITRPLQIACGLQACKRSVPASSATPIYLRSDSYFDAWSLLEVTPKSETDKLAELDKLADFVVSQYMEAEPIAAVSHGRSWLQWLETVVGLRRSPFLFTGAGLTARLSPLMVHILKTRPADFVPTLQAHWTAEYQQIVAKSKTLKELLSSTEVQCEQTSPTALSRTWLPTDALKSEAEDIGLREKTPFLKLPGPMTDHLSDQWTFLSVFGVGMQPNLDYYLDLLSHAQTWDAPSSLQVQGIVTKIYTRIGTLCNLSQATFVKNRLTESRGIYVPSNAVGKRWRQPGECLWEAPSCISIKSALAIHYRHDQYIAALLRTYVQVQDVHMNDYLDQLRHLKRPKFGSKAGVVSHKVCAELYLELHKYPTTAELLEHMRNVIEKEKLVFVNSLWHSPSECLWSTDTSISDQISIAGIYVVAKDFFTSTLRVKKLTISMLVSDLKSKAMAKIPLSPANAMSLVLKINTLLSNESPDGRLQEKFNELKLVKCFPVRGKDGDVMLVDASADFAIVDNKRFGTAFTREADILDFGLDEVHVLRPFLEATDLTDHYLSHLVKEISDIEGSSVQSSELTNRLQGVAYAFFCCAVHFKSNKLVGQNTSLYTNLLNILVHEAERMGTSLVLKQHGRIIKVPSTRTQLKIDTDTVPWRIYVPRDVRARGSCYSSQLPQTILELLGISGPEATLVVNKLVNELHNHESESSVLEQFDVLPISWIERRPQAQTAATEPKAPENLRASSPSQLLPNIPNQDHATTSTPARSSSTTASITSSTPGSFEKTTNTSVSPFSCTGNSTSSTLFGGSPMFGSVAKPVSINDGATSVRSASTTSVPIFNFTSTGTSRVDSSGFGQSGLFGSADTPHRRSVSVSRETPLAFLPSVLTINGKALAPRPWVQQEKYRALLGNIINRVSGDSNVWDFNSLAEALPETVGIPLLFDKDETFGVRNEDHMAHDMKIGAAGEVFAFEKLLAAGLPGFTRNNWLSTIRHEAKVHERYLDMPDKSPDLPADSRAEPADIVYADPNGDFAKFLTTQDCVGVKSWLQNPPNPKRKYFIEVKTTTRSCETTFYMSKGQHSRMLDMRKKFFASNIDDVYIICRVYNLLSNDINMRFYVSPGRDEDAHIVPALRLGSFDQSLGGQNPFAGTAVSTQGTPILKFASKGFEVRPVK